MQKHILWGSDYIESLTFEVDDTILIDIHLCNDLVHFVQLDISSRTQHLLSEFVVRDRTTGVGVEHIERLLNHFVDGETTAVRHVVHYAEKVDEVDDVDFT